MRLRRIAILWVRLDPKKAEPNTIRGRYAGSIDENAVHGSDAAETAAEEIAFFFKDGDICARTR